MFRPMRRFKQQLTDEECIAILQNEPRGVLAVSGDDGYPYTVPLDFVYENGVLYFHCAKEGHKLDALRACDKASFCVLDKGVKSTEDWSYYFNSVVCFGRVKILLEKDEVMRTAKLLGMKYFPTEEEVNTEVARFADKVCMLAFKIEHMTGKHVHEK